MVDQAWATMIANVPEKTGKTLDAWIELLSGTGLEKHGQIVAYLKSEYGVTHGFANLIAQSYLNRESPPPAGDDLVAAQYEGAKAALRPIYDRLIEVVTALGDDVEIAPKKTSVSLRRSKQFALITAATRTRIDLGLNLPGEAPAGRLLADKGMCSHKIAITTLEEVDDEVIATLRRAYDGA